MPLPAPSHWAVRSYGASASEFSSTNSSINKAFLAVQSAEKSGGNVTGLVKNLNVAVDLIQKAQAENATNPSQATSDLQEANALASEVLSNSSSVASAGISHSRNVFTESVTAAIGILIVSSLVYIYGDRVYRQLWLQVFRNHLVRREEAR